MLHCNNIISLLPVSRKTRTASSISDKVAIALFNKLIPNAQPKDLEERDDVKFIIKHIGRAYSEEEQQCLDEVFEDWKKKKANWMNE